MSLYNGTKDTRNRIISYHNIEPYGILFSSLTNKLVYKTLGEMFKYSVYNIKRTLLLYCFPILYKRLQIEHVADIAFKIIGSNRYNIYINAQIALAEDAPSIRTYIQYYKRMETIDDVILGINKIVGEADEAIGVPLKAVSCCGILAKYFELETWEMIVDV